MSEILKAWEKLKGLTRRVVTGKISPDLSGGDEERIKKKISRCIYAKGGQIYGRSRAVELGKIYLNLSKKGREKFMIILAREFDVDNQKINELIQKFQKSGNEKMRIKAEMELSKALIAPRVTLLKQFNSLPNGFKFLIDFRVELLLIRNSDPFLEKLDEDLKDILSSWFDVGLLDLKEITWKSPASLLEKLIHYEAVHEIQSWTDLKNRLDSDRMCFSFFHNKIPDEPLIFLEVALVKEITGNIQKLLDEKATTITPEEADTAIFYSISNTQKGLEGINLGNFLIKRVVNELSDKFKGLKHFVTLSPIPGFREWLDPILLKGDASIFSPAEIKILQPLTNSQDAARGLLDLLNSNWHKNLEISKTLKSILMRLCASYLINEKKDEKALDPVANFHLTNGAHIEQLNWLGDTSEKGMKQSAGIMTNYHYKLSEIEKNHELYITESRINAEPDVKKWIKKF
jgi:malonyl-CoA decarboxylase